MRFSRALLVLAAAAMCRHESTAIGSTGKPSTCASSPSYKTRPSIFDQLNDVEVKTVATFVAKMLGLNATDEEPSIEDCDTVQRIFKVEKFPMVKADAIAHLEDDGPKPGRYAKVTIVHAPVEVMEYKVGPLPITDKSTITAMFAPGTIPWNSRPQFPCEFAQVREFAVKPVSAVVKDLMLEMTNGFCFDDESCKPGMDYDMFADPLSSPTDRISTIQYMFLPIVAFGFEYTNTSGYAFPSMFPIPLTYKVSHGKPDPSTWKTYDFEYCGQGPFESAEELMAAYEVGDVEICDLGLTDDYDALWAGLKRRGPMRKRSNRAVPVISSPDGPRFTLSGRSVEWMGWSFHVDLHPRYGPIFSDIKFKGERIFYEMSLQETYTAYSGYSGHGEIMYLDSHYGGLGNLAFTLLKGTDCPENAAYLPGYDYDKKSFEPELRPDSMCIYEMINGETAWRHTTFSDPLGIPHVFLGVRSLHTVSNYDYNLETQFNLDGSITLNLDAAGYMATAYPSKYDSGYGVKVQQFQSGALHDHILGWKLDMDILGTANNFAETKIKVVANEGPTKSTAYTKKAVKKTIETEAGFTLSHSEPNFFSIYNPTKLNKWGEPRGYYLSFEGSIRNLLPKDHPASRAASWSNYNCMVTKRKEEEPYLSSEMNMLTARFPIVNASGFMDGESIIEEDLVLWIAIGKMHLPHSEDVPVVTNFGTTLDIRPRNYFDENTIFDIPLKSTDFSSCKPAVGEDFDYTPSEL